MKAPVMVSVALPCDAWRELLEAADRRGVRVGWLEWSERPLEVPIEVGRPLTAGCDRAVIVGADGALVLRKRRGPASLPDVIRSHLLGCELVLLHGIEGIPRLERRNDGYRLVGARGERLFSDPDGLIGELLRPRWRFGS